MILPLVGLIGILDWIVDTDLLWIYWVDMFGKNQ